MPYDISFAVDAYYSIDADGYFVEFSLGKEFEITDRLTASLTGIFGINHGYIPDGHSGANHVAATLGLEYALTEKLAITGHLTQSWEINSDPNFEEDEQLRDVFIGGVGLRWFF